MLQDRYNPSEVESKIYQWWLEKGYFKAYEKSTKPPYATILPPPNVTGFLHLGHALNQTIQDTLSRWKRMSGFNVLWMPGTDHAGIATQTVVEKMLSKEHKTTRQQLGREKFVEKIWEWKNTYGDRIVSQMKHMGDSCDWDRLRFTLDETSSHAVKQVFVDLYKQGLIYKGTRLVNWSPALESAVSDLEVDHLDQKGTLWHIQYPVDGTQDVFVVATTRPETMLGDTAVAVNPHDDRYQHLVGKKVRLPLTNRLIPIIADDYVDKDFGSGVVKITPGHDFNDYEVGKRNNLTILNILNVNGTLNEHGGKYKGLKTQEARKQVLADLKEQNLLVKEEPHPQKTPICSRTGVVIEPMISDQWFLKMQVLAEPAKRVVESGTITFEPESWTKTYLHWMNNIQDWCVSRQLWWGHRIPVFNCGDCKHHTVSMVDATECEKCKSKNILQDSDVLDTWFSSALWPFSTMGWPTDTELQKTFYPTNDMVTGHDIIFFWVARMIMMGLHFKKDVPFRKVYLHGLVRDSQGRKMSKSLGNSIDPLEMIQKFGADSLRFNFLTQVASGKDMKFSEQRIEGYRNFMNKIWNATRFSLGAMEGFIAPAEGVHAVPPKADLSSADQWLVFKLSEAEKQVGEALENYRFSDAANTLYQFTWNVFCDWYLEFVKPVIYGVESSEKKAVQLILAQTLNRIMRLLHPMIPFITEEIYQKLPIKSEALIIAEYPTPQNDKIFLSIGTAESAFEMDVVKEVITAIRNIRGENQIKPAVKMNVRLVPFDELSQKILGANKTQITRLAGLEECHIGEAGSLTKCAVSPVRLTFKNMKSSIDVVIPLEGLVNIEEEIARIDKNIEKIQKDISLITKKFENENFMKNAPEEVIEADKVVLTGLKSRLESLQQSLNRLR